MGYNYRNVLGTLISHDAALIGIATLDRNGGFYAALGQENAG